MSIFSFGTSRGKWVEPEKQNTHFSDVAGVDEAKEELEEIVSYLKSPAKYTRLGARIPRGVLLVGPPGTGKTLLAKAVAGEAGVPFMSISGSEFVEMLVGVGAARVRSLFAQAKQNAPCIVFIDELDALGRSRSQLGGGHEEREQTLNQMLVEMDGFNTDETVIVLGATNRPEVLDPALLRPGRFDRQVLVDLPDREGREAILRVHVKGVQVAEDVDLTSIARRTPGFAGADLANLINETALLSARADQDTVNGDAFSEAIDRVVAGLKKKNRLVDPEDRRRVAYHEVGHALAAYLANRAALEASGSGKDGKRKSRRNMVEKISIVPRGLGALGFTMHSSEDDRQLMTQEELMATLVGVVGGRVAEEIVFGSPSTGAQNDLQKATELARAMVVDYGMSEAVGPINIRADSKSVFLNDAPSRSSQIGEHLADTIDSEIRSIVEKAFTTARELLTTHRPDLDRISERLLEIEVLEGEELVQLLDAVR